VPTTPKQLITEAKRLQRLQTRRATIRRELKSVDDEIRLVRRNVKALSQMDPDDQLPPAWKGRIE
jgi:chaperonin cofactor prefoldin